MKSARETALLILYKTEFEGAYPNLELKTGLPSQMEQRDKSFVTALVYGVISKRLTLDYIIEQHSKIKLKKLSKYIHLILRMGLYQIFFMDKIPQSAAVNESVKLARRYGHGASAGFVNGLLRNAAKLVKKGGRILYSTCTIRKAENEEIVKAFLTENKNAVLKYEHTFLPHKETADGFYTALIEIN